MANLKASRVVILLDVCHAGSFADSNLAILEQAKKDLSDREGLVVISAVGPDGSALELPKEFGHGAFTQALLDTIPKSGFPWRDANEFFPAVQSRVLELTQGMQIHVLTLDVKQVQGDRSSDPQKPRGVTALP